jgi:uncharacterized protein YacL
MVYVRTRTFCCCLPVRLGVFILAILGVLIGGFLTVAGWLQVANLTQHPLSTRDEVALYVQTVMFTLLAVVSIFGFIGAASRRRSLLNFYWMMLAAHLVFSIASGIFSIYSMFNEDISSEFTEQCADDAVDDVTDEFCGNGMTVVKGLIIAFFVISWLFQLYGCIIVSNYVEQLDDEKSPDPYPAIKSAFPAGAIPVTTYNSYGGTNYAFTQPHQSFDANGHSRV